MFNDINDSFFLGRDISVISISCATLGGRSENYDTMEHVLSTRASM